MLNIYVANLGKYNEGFLVGDWLELPVSQEELEEFYVSIKVAHYDEEGEYVPSFTEGGCIYEEVAIHDYETDLPIKIHEYDSIEDLNATMDRVESLTDYEQEHLAAYMEVEGGTLESCLDSYEDTIFYPGYDLEDVAYEYVEELNLPDFASRYFDYSALARDLSYDGYTETKNGVLLIA